MCRGWLAVVGVLLVNALLAVGCSSTTRAISAESVSIESVDARKRLVGWDAVGPAIEAWESAFAESELDGYRLEILRDCFCYNGDNPDSRSYVAWVADSESIRVLDGDGTTFDEADLGIDERRPTTLPELYVLLRSFEGQGDVVATVENGTMLYPVRIDLDPVVDGDDDELGFGIAVQLG